MIILGVPCMGTIPIKVVGAIEQTMMKRKDVFPYYVANSLVYDARYKIARFALENNADLLFIDSDILFSLEAFDRLLSHKNGIVAGLYYSRNINREPIAYKTVRPSSIFHKLPTREVITDIEPYMEIQGCGLGFCLIRHSVLQDLLKNPHKNPFEPYKNLGEDFSFLYRCRKKGYKIMLDTTLGLKHLGEYEYGGEIK